MSGAATAKPVALITGASTGIGAAYARTLAREGYDLVLVARDEARLEAVAVPLRERHDSAVECLRADLSRKKGVASVASRISEGAAIDLLINNAGRGSFGRFWTLDAGEEAAQTHLNATAVQRLSHAALGRFVPRRRGAIIFVSSLSGLQPSPYSATYAATKAYVNAFAESLREELRGTGVRIQLLCPGFTRTEFQDRAAVPKELVPRIAWTGVDVVVQDSLHALARDQFRCVPGAFSRGLGGLMRIAPRALTARVMGWVTRSKARSAPSGDPAS